MPLASTANEIKRVYENVKKPFAETLEVWRNLERKEMETFAATNPPEGKAFAASDDLKRSLRAWSLERHKANVIEKWTYLFTETYVELLSGKITLGEAEERLKRVNPINLSAKCHNIVYPELKIMCQDIVYPLKDLERAKGGVDREKSLPVLPPKRPGFGVSRS